jgi:hypothetical protein
MADLQAARVIMTQQEIYEREKRIECDDIDVNPCGGCESPLHAQTAQPYQGVVGRTLAESKEWWPEPVKAPAGAPNVVWILIDDVGYGAAGTFGGLIQTPTFDSLANNGLRYTNFHTTRSAPHPRSSADRP